MMGGVGVTPRNVGAIIENPASATTKRLAWAYGCARKGSPEEQLLYDILCARLVQEAVVRGDIQ